MSRDDRAWRDYARRFRQEVLPKVLSSAVFLSIQSGDGTDFDVRQATEIGAALLLGKPVLLLVLPGTRLPAGLRRAADAVLEDWDATDPTSHQRLGDAIDLAYTVLEERHRATLAAREVDET